MSQDWDALCERYEGWWEGEATRRPIVRIYAPAGPSPVFTPPHDPAALFDWLSDPQLVLPRLEARLAATCYAGDAFAWGDPVALSLAAIEAAYLGAPYALAAETLSGWAGPSFEEWSDRPRFTPQEANPWWRSTRVLLEAGARQAGQRWRVGIPDLQGGGEILALLRGSENLALDLRDHPDEIAPALAEINAAWLYYFRECYAAIHRWQDGYVDWLGIWSQRPAATVECDYMVMVSPRYFERFFLPAVNEQVEMVERALFHLDGPGAVKHLDFLLALPRLRGIQWVATPERPHPAQWLPMFKRIQAAGKRLILTCAPEELEGVLDELRPQGLLVDVNCANPAEAEELAVMLDRRYGATGK